MLTLEAASSSICPYKTNFSLVEGQDKRTGTCLFNFLFFFYDLINQRESLARAKNQSEETKWAQTFWVKQNWTRLLDENP